MVERRPPKPEVEGSSPSSPAGESEIIMSGRIGKYISGVKLELKKVSWLTKNEAFQSTLIVGVFAVIVAMFLFIVDAGMASFMERIFKL